MGLFEQINERNIIFTQKKEDNATTRKREQIIHGINASANTCLNCLAGFFANETQLNKERCQKCSTGQYSNEEGSSVCTLCPKGFESSGS